MNPGEVPGSQHDQFWSLALSLSQVLFHPIALLDKVSIGEVMLVLSCLLEVACLRADSATRPFASKQTNA